MEPKTLSAEDGEAVLSADPHGYAVRIAALALEDGEPDPEDVAALPPCLLEGLRKAGPDYALTWKTDDRLTRRLEHVIDEAKRELRPRRSKGKRRGRNRSRMQGSYKEWREQIMEFAIGWGERYGFEGHDFTETFLAPSKVKGLKGARECHEVCQAALDHAQRRNAYNFVQALAAVKGDAYGANGNLARALVAYLPPPKGNPYVAGRKANLVRWHDVKDPGRTLENGAEETSLPEVAGAGERAMSEAVKGVLTHYADRFAAPGIVSRKGVLSAALPIGLYAESLIPPDERDGFRRSYSITLADMEKAGVVAYRTPHKQREYESRFLPAFDLLNMQRVLIHGPDGEGVWIYPYRANQIPQRWDSDKPLTLEVAWPKGTRAVDVRLDAILNLSYNRGTQTQARLYLVIQALQDLAASGRNRQTREIAAALLGPGGEPRRGKGGRIRRDKNNMQPNPGAGFMQPVAEEALVRTLWPQAKRAAVVRKYRQRLRAAIEGLAQRGLIDPERTPNGWRFLAPRATR